MGLLVRFSQNMLSYSLKILTVLSFLIILIECKSIEKCRTKEECENGFADGLNENTTPEETTTESFEDSQITEPLWKPPNPCVDEIITVMEKISEIAHQNISHVQQKAEAILDSIRDYVDDEYFRTLDHHAFPLEYFDLILDNFELGSLEPNNYNEDIFKEMNQYNSKKKIKELGRDGNLKCGKEASMIIKVVAKKLGLKHEVELKAFSVLEKMLSEDKRK